MNHRHLRNLRIQSRWSFYVFLSALSILLGIAAFSIGFFGSFLITAANYPGPSKLPLPPDTEVAVVYLISGMLFFASVRYALRQQMHVAFFFSCSPSHALRCCRSSLTPRWPTELCCGPWNFLFGRNNRTDKDLKTRACKPIAQVLCSRSPGKLQRSLRSSRSDLSAVIKHWAIILDFN